MSLDRVFAQTVISLLLLPVPILTATAWGAAPEPNTPHGTPTWLVRPAQTGPRILTWAKEHPDLVRLESQTTFDGHTAYAVTVTNRQRDDAAKKALLFSQPHAHEPATTAGMMEVLSQLIEGRSLDGRPAALDRQRFLDQAVLSFIPDGNPDGRARAPEDAWDGTKHTNQEFLDMVFGRLASGQRAPRVGRWSLKDQQPALIGFVYERISQDEYVEPNRDLESTFFKLVRRMFAQRRYDLYVDLHQTEFEKSDRNCLLLLPFLQKELPQPIREANESAGRAVIAAWQKLGASPVPNPQPLGYGEDQIRYFRRAWSEIYQGTTCISVEVQNNNVRTPPETQKRLVTSAIQAGVEHVLTSKN